MANSNWTASLYYYTSDLGSPPYDTIATSTLTGGGATTVTGFIIAPQAQWAWERYERETVAGWKTTTSRKRGIFVCEFYPATWAAGGDQDLTDIDDISKACAADFLWLRISTPERDYPSTASTAYPVVVSDFVETVKKETGLRGLQVTFEHRGIALTDLH